MPPSQQAPNKPMSWWIKTRNNLLILAAVALALTCCALVRRCEKAMDAGKECSPCKTDADCNKGLTCSSFTYKNNVSHDRCVGEVRKQCPL